MHKAYHSLVTLMLAFLAAPALAQYQDTYYPNPYSQNPFNNPQVDKDLYCFAERCEACRDNFDYEPILNYDCYGKCGLCKLCSVSNDYATECRTWCKVSAEDCTYNCLAGKQICAFCATKCGLILEKQVY